ncbi:MAG: hypothetical protein ACHQHN_01735 [Sphingobacteriales bacterium]
MKNLLDVVIEGHGGLGRWKQYRTMSATQVTGGVLWPMKGVAGILDKVNITIDLNQQWVSHSPFQNAAYHTSVKANRVAIETNGGKLIEELLNPRLSLQGHTLESQYSKLQLAYVAGYSIWTYLTSPFSFTEPGFETREMEPWEENGETWRRLKVKFPDYIATHSKEQVFYINSNGLIRRHDYDVEVSGNAPVVQYLDEHREIDGIVVATERKVYVRQEDNTPLLPDPLLISISLSEINFSK